MKLEENPLGILTDDIDKAKSNSVQIHHNRLESHYERNTGNISDVTPKTGQFMSMVSDMIDFSKMELLRLIWMTSTKPIGARQELYRFSTPASLWCSGNLMERLKSLKYSANPTC
jgi:hypothetical protein